MDHEKKAREVQTAWEIADKAVRRGYFHIDSWREVRHGIAKLLKENERLASLANSRYRAGQVEGARRGAGWMLTDNCVSLDRGEDPRKKNVPEMIERMRRDLALDPSSVVSEEEERDE